MNIISAAYLFPILPLSIHPKLAVGGGFHFHGTALPPCHIQRDTHRFRGTTSRISPIVPSPRWFLTGEALIFIKGMAVDAQRGTELGVAQQACHRPDIHALGDEHAGVGVTQTVHIQIFRQSVLAQNFWNRKVNVHGPIGSPSACQNR